MTPPAVPLTGFRIGVTAARKVDEQIALLERRGAQVTWAPALSMDPNQVDDAELRAATDEVLSRPIDMFLATTGIGMRTWFDAADTWGIGDELVAAIGQAEILARGPKSVGALRRRGLRELWAPESECFEDVLQHLRGRELTGLRIVVQEHGQSLSMVAHALRRAGADVSVVTVYRVAGAEDPEPMFKMIDLIADRQLDAVTFTSAPAVAALMDAAGPPAAATTSSPPFRPTSSPPASARSPPRRSSCGACRRSSPTAPAWRRWSSSSRPSSPRVATGCRWSWPTVSSCCCTGTTCCWTGSRSASRLHPPPCCRRWSPTRAT